MKIISVTALSVFMLIFVFMSASQALSLPPDDPQNQISGQWSYPGDKIPPVKIPPCIALPKQPGGTCPQVRYIDCMPPLTDQARQMCGKDYLEWIKEHCPCVKVVF